MNIKTVLFDLDGTLLPMNQDEFIKTYFKLLLSKMAVRGYEPEKLGKTIWAGTAAMIKNDGSKINEEVFWDTFKQVYGQEALSDIPMFDEFYSTDFLKAQKACGFNPKAAQLINKLKQEGLRLVLATNPVFPAIATENRIRWAGLDTNDFEIYTTYENSSYCKPNTKYYLEILNKLGCKSEECLMVGNDVTEDMAAAEIGMHVFLLTDCLINKNNRDISAFAHGGFDDLLEYIRSL